MRIRLVHIDGRFPNLALMKLSCYFKEQGAEVFFTHSVESLLWEDLSYDLVLGSVVFRKSLAKVAVLKSYFPTAVVGGPGTETFLSVEDFLHVKKFEKYDYSLYPEVKYSIGFSSRGCRFACPFCIVSKKEGKIRSTQSITDIWRGKPFPKKLLVLDNDFFGQENWEDKCHEILTEHFRVSICQGINLRTLTPTQAEYIKKMRLLDNDFKQQRIYTSWDNVADESTFKRGLEHLFSVGIKPHQVMVFYLTNFTKPGLTKDVWYRHHQLKKLNVRQFPMIFEERENTEQENKSYRELRSFQSWVIRRLYYKENFKHYFSRRHNKLPTPAAEKLF